MTIPNDCQEDLDIQVDNLGSDNEMIRDLELFKQKELLLPSMIFFQGNKPLAFVGGQLLHFFSPILAMIAPTWIWERWARVLSRPKRLTQLLKSLENDL